MAHLVIRMRNQTNEVVYKSENRSEIVLNSISIRLLVAKIVIRQLNLTSPIYGLSHFSKNGALNFSGGNSIGIIGMLTVLSNMSTSYVKRVLGGDFEPTLCECLAGSRY